MGLSLQRSDPRAAGASAKCAVKEGAARETGPFGADFIPRSAAEKAGLLLFSINPISCKLLKRPSTMVNIELLYSRGHDREKAIRKTPSKFLKLVKFL